MLIFGPWTIRTVQLSTHQSTLVLISYQTMCKSRLIMIRQPNKGKCVNSLSEFCVFKIGPCYISIWEGGRALVFMYIAFINLGHIKTRQKPSKLGRNSLLFTNSSSCRSTIYSPTKRHTFIYRPCQPTCWDQAETCNKLTCPSTCLSSR